MKFIKIIFSRLVVFGLAVLLQLGLIWGLLEWLKSDIIYVNIAITIISIIIFLFVIDDDQPSAFKLPWIVLILIVPIIGIIAYLFYGEIRISRNKKTKMTLVKEKINEYKRNDEIEIGKLKEENVYVYGQMGYIRNTAITSLYTNNKCEFLSSGEKYFERLLSELKSAEKYIFMEYFIIEEGYMFNAILEILTNKVKQGVEVYLMYDDVGSIAKVPGNYYRKLRELGINCVKFNKIIPIISATYNNRDHRKITVIDGIKVFTGGVNLADEYINKIHPLGHWKDNGLYIEGKAVSEFVLMFIELYNIIAEKQLDYNEYIVKDIQTYETHGYIMPYGDGPIPFNNLYIAENAYINMINGAKKYVYITTPYLVVSYHFLNALKVAVKRGVDVRIILPHKHDKFFVSVLTKSNYYNLIQAGIKIYEYKEGFIHAKSMDCDGELGIVGTINFDYRSLVHHYECAVWMYNVSALSSLHEDLQDVIDNHSILITLKVAKRKRYPIIIKGIMKIFAPLF